MTTASQLAQSTPPVVFDSPLWGVIAGIGMTVLTLWVLWRVTRVAALRTNGWDKGAKLGWLPAEFILYSFIALLLLKPTTIVTVLDIGSTVVDKGIETVNDTGETGGQDELAPVK